MPSSYVSLRLSSLLAAAAVVTAWAACSESNSSNGGPTSAGSGSSTTNGSGSGAGGSPASATGSNSSTGPVGTGGEAGSSSATSGSGGTGTATGGASGGSAGSGAGGSKGGAGGAGGGAAGTSGTGTGGAGLGGAGGGGGASVLQHHKNASRDGLYVDAAFTKAAAARIHMDTTFKATIQGPTFAQPLYFEGGSGGRDIVVAVTTQNRVYALDASNGTTLWEKQVGTPVPQGSLPCGNINPLGIIGTPVIDAASRTLFFDAMTTPDGGTTKKRLIFALSLEDGSTRAGWPVDVSATVKAGQLTFNSSVQSQRAALALVNGTVYVPYGGHWGDCGSYKGWVVGVPINNPAAPKGFATSAPRGGGIWGVGGIASDGTSLFVATGNTFDTNTWAQGEAVLRLSSALAFSGQPADYFTPSNWLALDGGDLDLGGSNAILLDVPGATPSQLVAAFGKNGVTYLLNRNALGGVGTGNGTTGEGVVSAKVVSANTQLIQAAAAYKTGQASYIAMGGAGGLSCPGAYGGVTVVKVGAASPPTLTEAWCGGGGFGSPIVTTTGTDTIVWWLSADGNNRLQAFDGDTGQVIFNGGGNGDGMSGLRKWIAPIAAKGRIFVAADTTVYAFTMN